MLRRATAVLLASLLSAPSLTFGAGSAPGAGSGVVEGVVRLGDRPLSGMRLAFVEIASGQVVRATSRAAGTFRAAVPPGEYVVAAEGGAGLIVAHAPTVVPVAAGQVASANIGVVALPGARLQQPSVPRAQEAPLTPSGTTIQHEAIACFVAGEFPLVPARIEPADKVARGRVFFRAAQSSAWYYVEMTPSEDGFVGKLPRPKLEASPITYYVEGLTTEFGEARTVEISALVVREEKDCEGRAAAIGPPGDVTVFSAATGAAIRPIGFAAGGLLAAGGALLLLAGGAAAVGIAAATDVFNPQPTPTPSAQPTPTPTPTPGPVASPSPSPSPSPTTPPIPGTPFR